MKIAIIGAGGAGLAAAKYSAENGFECEVFEQTGLIGGIWNYTDQVGIDDYDLPVHSPMYKGLMTNVPKELMYYPDFPYPDNLPSYIEQEKVLQYIHDYAKHFDLYRHIQFYKHVTRVHPVLETKWEITIQDLKNKTEETKVFDAVMVCKGNFNYPRMPHLPKIELFKGNTMHSHDYRCPDKFKGKRVLVIGAGPSGRDIANLISSVTEKVLISHSLEKADSLAPHLIQKPEVEEFCDNGAIFKDGTKEEVDEVIYCTGYKYDYPFLTDQCGIQIVDNFVQPLYKHLINVNHPTMCIIGVPFLICPFPTFDIQVRFFLASLSGYYSLPPKSQMLKDLNDYKKMLINNGVPNRHAHKIGKEQGLYFDELADLAQIKRIPPVISKLYVYISDRRNNNDSYKIVVLSLEKSDKSHSDLPIVKEFYTNGVIFVDDKKEEIDEVIYCTGYTFEYPFLTKECGITMEDNWIKPLYKHIININHPTMGFIGKPFLVCCFPLFDIQARFFLSTLNGHFCLPRKEEMLEDLKNYVKCRDEEGIPRRNVHQIGETQGDHFEDLANTAKIKPIPPVLSKLYLHIKKQERTLTDVYRIIDDETFIQTA